MIGNQSRGIVSRGASRRNTGGIHQAVDRSDEALATFHGLPNAGISVATFRVKFDAHAFGINIAKKYLDLKQILLPLLLDCRGAEPEFRPVLREIGLPIHQLSA